MLRDRVFGRVGKVISYILIVTTQAMTAHIAYAQDRMANAIAEANQLAVQLSNRSLPHINANGDVIVNGEVLSTGEQLTGQKSNDYLPAQTNTYGSDGGTILQGQQAQSKYEQKTAETAETSGEIAYHILKKSFSTQKPDLSNDPMWNNTDNVLANLPDIADGFANCEIDKELVSSGSSYHVPKYETCEKLPAIEESFTIIHDYEVGVVKHDSGPVNLGECGDGCLRTWIGTVGNDYWGGNCVLMTEEMSIEVIQPSAIISAKLERAKFDDHFRVSMNDDVIYIGPYSSFPTWAIGVGCELSTSWDKYPNIDITSSFTNLSAHDIVRFKNETLVDSGGDALGGEGYSSILIHYDPTKLIYNDVWTTLEQIDKALEIKTQLDDGYCTGHITCTDMPALDENGCRIDNGIKVCESDFQSNPIFGLGISPFCKRVDVVSDCGFNDGEICFTDMDGVENCFDNGTVDRNTCQQYENDPECSYVKTECVGGAEGDSGNCYVQEDTYDCGFTATTGQETEEDVLRCDGQIQCIGESCYSPVRDTPNDDFGNVNAYLEMLKYARSDMSCLGVPERPFDEESPPDRYYPIEGCAEGFVYNATLDKCLSNLGCDYDDANFYAASYRDGIQVVKQNSVIADNGSVTQCIPVQQGNYAYTCGNAQQRVGTDTFYEVCTNEVAATVPNSCPSDSHSLNTTTGYCEVPPSPSCPDDYELVEGNDEWSTDDDVCVFEAVASDQCPSGGIYDATLGQCVTTSESAPYCQEGSLNSEGRCVDHITEIGDCYYEYSPYDDEPDPQYYCLTMDSDPNPPKDFWTRLVWNNRTVLRNAWDSGLSQQGWACGRQRYFTSEDDWDGNNTDYYWYHEICQVDSWTEDFGTPKCRSGAVMDGDVCKTTSTYVPTPQCPSGSVYVPEDGVCRSEIPATPTCPSMFPVWNETEQRCQSDPYEAINTTSVEFNQNNLGEDAIANVQLKQLMNSVLAPFAYLMDAAVPSVIADAELHDTEESQVTQESMNKYIAGKFGEIAETMDSDLETYQLAQAQLGVRAMAAAPQVQSIASSQASTTGGDQNVTCELFKGEAMECKIAVGGMQNCCENPVAVSLSDYISLTRSMMSMDAMTGAVFNIEGYHGVWEMGKGYVAEGAESAWNFVSSPWASGADAATGVGQAASEAATEGMMHTFSQSIMTYTNDFLIQTFGEEVAALFFQQVGETAAGEAVLGASAQMAAVGQVLMYCYYAYLAYVVFNLLINIIFACEDAELDLAMKRDLLSTHYIGSYCKTEVLFACIEKRNVHCAFDSPLSRIMMEQIYKQPQMGLSWGSPESPNCRGIGIAELDKVDWDQVNLDEWIGILIQTDNYTDMVNIDLDSLTGTGSSLQTGDDRMDVLERNQERFIDVDIDDIRRDAYEDGWNRNQ